MSRRTARWARRILFGVGFSALAYAGFTEASAWKFQHDESLRLDAAITSAPPADLTGPADGDLIGRVEIPRLGVSVIVVEGATDTELKRAAGHIAGTAFPGEPGNTAIAAHRDTYFRPLREIEDGDTIFVTTPQARYRYRVVSSSIVSPLDVSVLDPGNAESITLVTCHPFYYVGRAPNRFVVKADRVF